MSPVGRLFEHLVPELCSTVWEGCGTHRGWNLAGGVSHWGVSPDIYSLPLLPVSFLLSDSLKPRLPHQNGMCYSFSGPLTKQ